MSKLKKVLLICTAYVLVAALAIGGTIAYLTSQDSDVNVMTMGNVSIEQIEQQYDENGNLVPFEQDKPLYPYVGTLGWKNTEYADGAYRQFTMNNVVDKYVSVKNTGKSDAYVRTLIAFELGNLTIEEFDKYIGASINSYNGSEYKFNGAWKWDGLDYNNIIEDEDGNKYVVYTATHLAPLAPGEETVPSLLQVYMDKTATNEIVEKLDSNSDGNYNILVLSQAIQSAGFENAGLAWETVTLSTTSTTQFSAEVALNTGYGTPVEKAEEWFDEIIEEFNTPPVDVWDGTADTSWYDPANPLTEYEISTAEQLAGLADLVDAGNTFAGKTIKLGKNIDMYIEDENGEPICFDPIGSYRKDEAFKGVFDGQGHTISNLYQNTWALDNGYSYGDLGLGLFGLVEDATVKNLVIDNANISGESAICGTVAACAYGECTFENITVTNSKVADYQYYAGGIVGWASGDHKYIICNVDETTTIAAQWGDFDNSTGGLIGGAGGSAKIYVEKCNISCRIDAYNDVTSSYQWYAYRRCGMIIGNTGKTKAVDGTTYADAPQLTCKDVTVTYGTWANYTYCEFAGASWPYVRVQAGVSNSAYSNPRYGHPTDANGNKVVDDNHVHNAGEDHFIECTFDQLYGGGQGVYGTPAHDGVTVVYNNK